MNRIFSAAFFLLITSFVITVALNFELVPAFISPEPAFISPEPAFIGPDVDLYGDLNNQSLKQCITDLSISDVESFSFPQVKRPDVKIKFFVIPEGLPTGGVKWSDCYMNAISSTYNKEEWNYYFAKQLEDHPWRVYDPNEALLFVLPWMQFGGQAGIDKSLKQDCSPLFKSTEEILKQPPIIQQKYPQINDKNMVFLMGAYWIEQRINAATDKNPELLPKMPTIYETAPVCRLAFHPYQVTMPLILNSGLCFPGYDTVNGFYVKTAGTDLPDKSKRLEYCKVYEERLAKHSELSNDMWLQERRFKMGFIGKMDQREAYNNRVVFSHGIKETLVNDDIDDRIKPSFLLFHHVNTDIVPDGSSADQCRLDLDKFAASHDLRYDKGLYCPGTFGSYMHTVEEKYPTANWDLKLNARTVLSLRGDNLGSQRSMEGMYYGSPTWHDTPLTLLALSNIPMGNHVPWRLTGYFDENECLTKHVQKLLQLYRDSTNANTPGNEFQFLNGEILHNGQPYTSSAEEKILEKSMIQCTYRLIELIERDSDVLTLMRRAIEYYRDDVLWETSESRLGENLLFLVASGLDDDMLMPFGLNKNHFAPQVPRSCTGDTLEILDTIRKGTTKQAWDVLMGLGDYAQIRGWFGEFLSCRTEP
eukprot:GHVH01006446.1.p1 GENE.GHVH01006446.1~~GHVH01006446.1.p1  ORF type:complete len:646 (+),score=64.63 GHVH01006446.1:246-2183(+)